MAKDDENAGEPSLFDELLGDMDNNMERVIPKRKKDNKVAKVLGGFSGSLEEKLGKGKSALAHVAAGGAIGAGAGTIVPGIGNIIGALGGGAFGLYSWWQMRQYQAKDPAEEEKEKQPKYKYTG